MKGSATSKIFIYGLHKHTKSLRLTCEDRDNNRRYHHSAFDVAFCDDSKDNYNN